MLFAITKRVVIQEPVAPVVVEARPAIQKTASSQAVDLQQPPTTTATTTTTTTTDLGKQQVTATASQQLIQQLIQQTADHSQVYTRCMLKNCTILGHLVSLSSISLTLHSLPKSVAYILSLKVKKNKK